MGHARFVETLLDLVYPPKCALCDVTGPRGLCDVCRDEMRLKSDPVVTYAHLDELHQETSFYCYEGRAAQAVQRLKYERATSLAAPMSALLRQNLVQHGLLEVDAIVPVPIHWQRRNLRGFNQSELLCEALERDLVQPDLLRRIRATRPQVGLTPEQRLHNLRGAFAAQSAVAGLRVLLIDDVITSGHTVRECARALRDEGAAWVGACSFAGA
ncbi:MAG TPA: ComF family protein [Fimbriimonadaceae bacterium]|nr:ComF family protein [Fimbriimonadaceae bacterium]